MSRNISGKVKAFVFERDKGNCVYCGSTESLEFDHIIPASKGGSNTERNIQVVCMKCNRVNFNYIDDDDLLNEFPRIRKKGKQTINIRFPEKLLNVLQWPDNTSLFLKIKWDENENKGLFIAQNLQFGNILTLSSRGINIPIALARDLGLEHKGDINIVIKEIEGKKGLFLWKEKKKIKS